MIYYLQWLLVYSYTFEENISSCYLHKEEIILTVSN